MHVFFKYFLCLKDFLVMFFFNKQVTMQYVRVHVCGNEIAAVNRRTQSQQPQRVSDTGK